MCRFNAVAISLISSVVMSLHHDDRMGPPGDILDEDDAASQPELQPQQQIAAASLSPPAIVVPPSEPTPPSSVSVARVTVAVPPSPPDDNNDTVDAAPAPSAPSYGPTPPYDHPPALYGNQSSITYRSTPSDSPSASSSSSLHDPNHNNGAPLPSSAPPRVSDPVISEPIIFHHPPVFEHKSSATQLRDSSSSSPTPPPVGAQSVSISMVHVEPQHQAALQQQQQRSAAGAANGNGNGVNGHGGNQLQTIDITKNDLNDDNDNNLPLQRRHWWWRMLLVALSLEALGIVYLVIGSTNDWCTPVYDAVKNVTQYLEDECQCSARENSFSTSSAFLGAGTSWLFIALFFHGCHSGAAARRAYRQRQMERRGHYNDIPDDCCCLTIRDACWSPGSAFLVEMTKENVLTLFAGFCYLITGITLQWFVGPCYFPPLDDPSGPLIRPCSCPGREGLMSGSTGLIGAAAPLFIIACHFRIDLARQKLVLVYHTHLLDSYIHYP
jgi:hypothetical protein